jgi:hypothetical protein
VGFPVPAASRTAEASSDGSAFAFRVTTPPLRVQRQPDGYSTIEIEGFGTRQRRSGAPDIPTRTFLIAIPPGVEPRLEVVESESGRRFRPGLQVLRRSVTERHDPDPEIYQGGSPYPERLAWLGDTGILRDQRYVEIHVAPVRYDPATGGLEVVSALDLVVRFDGGAAAERAPREESRFESVYRRTFANYAQGKHFRLSAYAVPVGESVDASSEAGGGSAGGGGATPRYRIRVRENGLVRLDHTLLSAAGFAAHPIADWKLTSRGVAVPLLIQDAGTPGTLDPGDWVQFYGQALDDEPKAVLNYDVANSDRDLYEASDFTDESTYWLTIEPSALVVIDQQVATPQLDLPPPSFFTATARAEVDETFWPLADNDPWYWLPALIADLPPNPTSRLDTIDLPGLYSGTEPAQVRVQLRGISEEDDIDPDHLTRVTVENSSNQTLLVDNQSFDGRVVFMHDVPWTFSGFPLSDPVDVTTEVLSVGGSNDVFLDWIEIDYARSFTAIGDLLVFDWPDGTAEFIVDGLADTSPEIWEITRPGGQGVAQPTRLTGASVVGLDSIRFRVENDLALADGTLRRFLVTGAGAVPLLSGADFTSDTVSDLRDNLIQADLVVITHPDVVSTGPGQPLTDWLAHRATAAGGGLTSKVVLIEDVQDEFNFGLPGPGAIREFLRWILSDQPGEGWSDPRPSFVLLLGDGSYEYKGGIAKGNYVPTQIMFKDLIQLGYYSSDNVMAAVVGDDPLADLVVGRMPARSVAEADTMLQKVLDYETMPPAGSWRSHSVFISDRGKTGSNPGEALDFELTNTLAIDRLPAPYTHDNIRYWTDFCDPNTEICNTLAMNLTIDNAFNGLGPTADGAVLSQYIGHGNFVVWGDDAFFDERPEPPDTQDLTNGLRLPWLMAHNCLTGGFHTTGLKTMGEDWLKLPAGGAVGVFSASGLSFTYVGRAVSNIVWEDLFGPRKERDVAVPVMNSLAQLCGQGSVEPCQQYVLLGDPAMRFALPHVEPPTNVQAVGGNAEVTVSWTASTTPGAEYDIYRKHDVLFGTYEKANDNPWPASPFVDSGLINADTYLYYVVARDAQDFESRWSNFNSDCPGGPDCVSAVPLNPNKPVPPSGVNVADPGLGDQLQVSWLTNPEDDIAYYTIHYGTEPNCCPAGQGGCPCIHPFSQSVGDRTTSAVQGLTEGATYYFVVTATNTSDKTSDASLEVSDFPVLAPGLRPPAFIESLSVRPEGDNLVLEWDEVTTDIYGKPKAVIRYDIYRGVVPDFNTLDPLPYDSCPSPCSSYTDLGARSAPDAYFYRVRAVDAAENGGGLGSNVPRWTTLDMWWSGLAPGEIRLSWDAVDTTVDGDPLDLSHYAVYAADSPFTRAQVAAGAVQLLQTTTATEILLTPPAQSRYYSVLVVDIRGNVSPF